VRKEEEAAENTHSQHLLMLLSGARCMAGAAQANGDGKRATPEYEYAPVQTVIGLLARTLNCAWSCLKM